MTRRTATAAVVLLGLMAVVAALPVRAQPVPSALALATGLNTLAGREAKPLPDPFPIRRVLLADAAPLPSAPEGNPFRKVPREEFEKHVQAAARTVTAPPSLVQATYRANFANDSLAGSGEWVVSAAGDSALSLDPLKVAVRDLKWPDGRDAILWGGPTKLWVDRRGRTPVAFAWSARGVEEPGAVRFDLALPPAPLAALELTLPADRVPVAKRGQLLTGPFPAAGGLTTWRFAFGGESRLEFAVRRPAGSGQPTPFATFARTAKFDLAPGLATAAFEFDTAAVRGPVSALEFDADPALTVTDVTAPGLENWQAKDHRLTLTFREPLTAGGVTVSAVAALPAGGEAWPTPTVRPATGALTDDRIDVRLTPDVKLDGWSGGDFRLVRTTTTDHAFALSFKGGLPPEGTAARRPPTLRVRSVAAEFASVDAIEWRIDPHRSHLTARFRVAVSRGPLTRLTFELPPGFDQPTAVLSPDDPTATWSAVGGGLWALEPTQPIATGQAADVRIDLRGPAPKFDPPAARLTWPVPTVALVGSAKPEGTLTVQLSPALRGWLSHTADADGRTLKYTTDPHATLTLAAKPAAPGEAADPPAERPAPAEAGWRFADLTATVQLDAEGTPRGQLTGRVFAAAGRTLPVRLPAGATFDHATVDGKWADATEAEGTVLLPIPTPDADGVGIALAYHLPPVAGWRSRLGRTLPDLPGEPPIRATWTFARHRPWPTLAATADVPPEVLVPTAALHTVGFGLAAILVGFTLARLLSTGRRGPSRVTLLVVAAALGTVVWLAPDGWRTPLLPPLATALVGIIALSLAARGFAAIAVGFAVLPTVAQAPEPATVYFRQESAANPNQLSALVPQVLLDRLTALAATPLPSVVLTTAEYTGTEADGAARFEAAWTFHVTKVGPQQLVLPLGGVKLEAMALDGAAAYPDASQPNQYLLAVAGRGKHELKATFAVPVAATGGDRELRFAVPDLAGSRLTFALGAGGRQPTLAARTGGQTVTTADAKTTLQADLGRGTAVALRWREGMTANSPPAATVTEATVWDVSEARAVATSAFVYQIARGAVAKLNFDIPAGLEPGAVAIRTPADATNGLRNWTLAPAANGGQHLALELQNPAEGALAVTFRLVSKDVPTARPALRMPRATDADVTASYLGVRLTGLTAEGWQNEHLIDFPPDAAARDFAAVPDFDFDKTLTRSFRREGPAAPVARPVLRTPPPPPVAGHELTWSLGTRADVVGVARWPAGTVTPVVECDVPAAVTLTDVTAPDLAGWQRSGNRVRAWFKGDAKEPALRWAGAWPAYATGAAVELPGVPMATVRVRPVDDVALSLQVGRTTKLLPTPRPRETVYAAEADAAPPKFVAYPPAPTTLRQLDAVTRVGTALEHRVTLDVRLAPKRPHSFTLRVARPPAGTETRLEWPAGASVVEFGSDASHRRWQVNLAERADEVVRVAVVNRFPARPEVTLPAVDLLSGNVPAVVEDRRLALPPDFQPARGGDEPVRLIETAKLTPAVPRPEPVAVAAPPDPAGPVGRSRALAVGWLFGLLAVAGAARWGSPRWRPEVATGFGLLAVAFCGWGFGAVVAAGLFMRLVRVTRFVGQRVMR